MSYEHLGQRANFADQLRANLTAAVVPVDEVVIEVGRGNGNGCVIHREIIDEDGLAIDRGKVFVDKLEAPASKVNPEDRTQEQNAELIRAGAAHFSALNQGKTLVDALTQAAGPEDFGILTQSAIPLLPMLRPTAKNEQRLAPKLARALTHEVLGRGNNVATGLASVAQAISRFLVAGNKTTQDYAQQFSDYIIKDAIEIAADSGKRSKKLKPHVPTLVTEFDQEGAISDETWISLLSSPRSRELAEVLAKKANSPEARQILAGHNIDIMLGNAVTEAFRFASTHKAVDAKKLETIIQLVTPQEGIVSLSKLVALANKFLTFQAHQRGEKPELLSTDNNKASSAKALKVALELAAHKAIPQGMETDSGDAKRFRRSVALKQQKLLGDAWCYPTLMEGILEATAPKAKVARGAGNIATSHSD